MDEKPPREDSLYYVWGFHGLLLVDALSHTEAQERYCSFYDCSPTMIEFCMLVPDPDTWSQRPADPVPTPHQRGCTDEACPLCRIDPTYFPTTEIDPADPRVAWIDLEAEKAAAEANSDQLRARASETREGYVYGDGAPADS